MRNFDPTKYSNYNTHKNHPVLFKKKQSYLKIAGPFWAILLCCGLYGCLILMNLFAYMARLHILYSCRCMNELKNMINIVLVQCWQEKEMLNLRIKVTAGLNTWFDTEVNLNNGILQNLVFRLVTVHLSEGSFV